MPLSETEQGIEWLNNFGFGDRRLARRLLDSLALDSWTASRASLKVLLNDLISAGTQPSSWVIPVMDCNDIRKAKKLPKDTVLTAFDDFHPGMDIPTMPGSEAQIGNLIRDVQTRGVQPPTASIAELSRARVRNVFLVTDIIASGGQVVKYSETLMRNRTLRSWHSRGWLKVNVVTYAISQEGSRLLAEASSIDSVHQVRSAPSITALPWRTEDIDEAISLCTRYGQGRDLLGYGSHGGLFGFQERVPNTVPRIFRQSGTQWHPLFEGRDGRQIPIRMLRDIADGSTAPLSHAEILEATRQARLSVSVKKQQRRSNRDLLVVMSLLLVSPRRAETLGEALNLPSDAVEKLLRYLQELGWVTSASELTDAGARELAAAKRRPRRVEPQVPTSTLEPYYPRSLR